MYIDFNQNDYETVEDRNNYIPNHSLNYKNPIEYHN